MPELYAHLSRQEATALFRANIIGALATRELDRGELKAELRALSAKRFRPPGAKVTRCFSVPTLERWLYAYLRLSNTYRGEIPDRTATPHLGAPAEYRTAVVTH